MCLGCLQSYGRAKRVGDIRVPAEHKPSMMPPIQPELISKFLAIWRKHWVSRNGLFIILFQASSQNTRSMASASSGFSASKKVLTTVYPTEFETTHYLILHPLYCLTLFKKRVKGIFQAILTTPRVHSAAAYVALQDTRSSKTAQHKHNILSVWRIKSDGQTDRVSMVCLHAKGQLKRANISRPD